MTTPRLKPAKPYDSVAHEPVLVALHEARALAWFLEKLGDEDSSVVHGINEQNDEVEEVIPWVQQAIADRLRETHDTIEREYRKGKGGA